MSSQQLWPVTAILATDTQLSGVVNPSEEVRIDSIIAHNTSASTRTVEWYLVPPAGAPGLATRVHRSTIAVDAVEFVDGMLSRVIPAGGAVFAKADAVGVNTAATGIVRLV